MQAENYLLDQIQTYASQTLRKVAKHYDQDESYPAQEMDDLFEMGVLSFLVDKDNRAQGISDFLKTIRIISREFASVGSILLTQASGGILPIDRYGTQAQKDAYLADLVSGEKLAAFAIGERESGSYIKNIRTTARPSGQGWILDGEKTSISNAPVADVFFIVAKIEDKQSLADEAKVGIFIVEANHPQLKVEGPDLKMGIKALPVSNIQFKQLQLGQQALLGDIRDAGSVVDYLLNLQRLMIAAQSIGIARGAMDRGLKYVTYDRRFGQRLIDLQNTQLRLAEAQTKIEAATAFLHSIADAGTLDTRKISMIKLMASDMAIEVTETIMQVTGGYAYMRNNEIERFVRDAKVTAIYGGSSTTQKIIISRPWVNKRCNGGD